jgi:hypothetical protein
MINNVTTCPLCRGLTTEEDIEDYGCCSTCDKQRLDDYIEESGFNNNNK